MSFFNRESSSQNGKAASFYRLVWGNSVWRYTSADRDLPLVEDVAGVSTEFLYRAIVISDDGVVQGPSQNNDMTLTVQSDIPLVDLFRSTPPVLPIKLTILRRHIGDAEVRVRWVGTVGNVKRPAGLATATIVCRSLTTSLRRPGLRLAWTRGCPHVLYDSQCRADRETFAVVAQITAIAGGAITVSPSPAKPVDWFTGGFVQWDADGLGTPDRRGIERTIAADRFQIFGSTDRLAIGMAVRLYPGCNLTAETCETKFNNLANYGGFEQMTGKNPFDGTQIF